VIIALFMMRVSRQDLAGAGPEPAGDTSSPNPAETRGHRVTAIQPADAHRPGPEQA